MPAGRSTLLPCSVPRAEGHVVAVPTYWVHGPGSPSDVAPSRPGALVVVTRVDRGNVPLAFSVEKASWAAGGDLRGALSGRSEVAEVVPMLLTGRYVTTQRSRSLDAYASCLHREAGRPDRGGAESGWRPPVPLATSETDR